MKEKSLLPVCSSCIFENMQFTISVWTVFKGALLRSHLSISLSLYFFHLSYCHLPLIAPVSRLTRPWRVLSSLKSLYGVTNLCSVHLGKRKKTQKESRTTHVFSNPMLQDQHSPCWLNEPIHTKGGKSCKLTDVWGSDGRRGVYVLTRRRY